MIQSRYVIFNGRSLPENEAALGISDLSIVRGYGIFDYLKTVRHRPLFLEDNLDRFFNSAKLMDLPIAYSREELKGQIYNLMALNNIPDSGIKLLLTGGYSTDGYTIATPNLILTQHPLTRNLAQETNGLRLLLFPYHRAFPLVKSIDYVMGIQALKEAKSKGADDVLYVSNGIVTECPRANFFLVTAENKLLTPGDNVLAGITRKQIIGLLGTEYAIEIREVTVQDIADAKEAFITSTTKNITPVLALVGFKEFGTQPGAITKKLQLKLETLLNPQD